MTPSCTRRPSCSSCCPRAERALAGRRHVPPHPGARLVVRGDGHRLFQPLPLGVAPVTELRRRKLDRRDREGEGGSRVPPRTSGAAADVGNGQRSSFLSLPGVDCREPGVRPNPLSNARAVRPARAVPSNAEGGGNALALYASPQDAREKLAGFRQRYNEIRPHWALLPQAGGDPVTPADVYCRQVAVQLPPGKAGLRRPERKVSRWQTTKRSRSRPESQTGKLHRIQPTRSS